MNSMDFVGIAPLVVLLGLSFLLLLVDLFRGIGKSRILLFCLIAVGAMIVASPQAQVSELAFSGSMFVDGFTWLFTSLILLGLILTFLLNYEQLPGQRAKSGFDVDLLLVLAASGGIVMVSAANLILLFVGFELLSVCVYVLSGLALRERASAEGALKYFLMGAFSSAFLLYGMALVFGATGSMSIPEIAANVNSENLMLSFGIGLMIFGFGFKVSLVPFHLWTPDVYQGAPTSITAFMAVVVKVAAFGSFLRVMAIAFGDIMGVWIGIIWLLAVLSMTAGNLLALRQKSIKRMLAYSSIAHAGYVMMGFLAIKTNSGIEAASFYLVVYSAMTILAFGVLLLVTNGSDAQYDKDSRESFRGLGWTNPLLGVLMTIAMLALSGMPPFAGFVGKYYLFSSVIKAGYPGLAIIAAINSVISLYYYLSVVVVMYFEGGELVKSERKELPLIPTTGVVFASVCTVFIGLFSERFLLLIQEAVKRFG